MEETIEVMIENAKNKDELNRLLEYVKRLSEKESNDIIIPKFEQDKSKKK